MSYEHVGGGQYGVYRKKQGSSWPGVLGVLILVFILIAVFGGGDEEPDRAVVVPPPIVLGE